MSDPSAALREVQRLANWRDRDGLGLCDADLANAFLRVVLEADVIAAEDCLAVIPESAKKVVRTMLAEFAARDYYDDRHAYIRDGRTIEQRKQHYRKMQAHYRLVGQLLLSRLKSESSPCRGVADARLG